MQTDLDEPLAALRQPAATSKRNHHLNAYAMSNAGRAELQREVQRLMGRCMLRLQQYERLMKTILAHHELAGPVETLEAQRSARVEKLADKSLGHLVKALFDTYAVADGYERELLPEDKLPTDRISMAFSHRVTMEPERLARTRAAVKELVAMRNELVHHLIDRFDLWSEDGCAAAVSHLEGCFERIDLRHDELVAWAQGMDEACAVMASFAQTEVFHDVLVNGIKPDGSFEWSGSGIVQALREVNRSVSTNGWTRLDQALVWIASSHPEQKPAKYGCRTWPQVLGESRLFDLEYRLADDGRKVAWFRERRQTTASRNSNRETTARRRAHSGTAADAL